MKNKISLTFLAATLFLLCACQTDLFGPTESGTDNNAPKFRIAFNRPTTKGTAFLNTSLTDLNSNVSASIRIRSVASLRTTAGEVLSSDLFVTDAGKPTMGYLSPNASSPESATNWYLTPGYTESATESTFDFFPPFGDDVRLDALFLASVNDGDFNTTLGDPDSSHPMKYMSDGTGSPSYADALMSGWDDVAQANWFPVFEDDDDYTKKATFINVDTYEHRQDLMYAACNNIRGGEDKTVTFEHAQAMIIFNLNLSNKSTVTSTYSGRLNKSYAALLFVDPEFNTHDTYSSGPHAGQLIPLKDVLLKSSTPSQKKTDVGNILQDWNDVYGMLTLKTVGTFTVDNSKNTLEAKWDLSRWESGLSNYFTTIKDGVKADFSYAALKTLGTYTNGEFNAHQNQLGSPAVATSDYSLNLESTLDDVLSNQSNDNDYVEVAAQLIPEQEVVNPWLLLTADNGEHYFLKEVNLPRGTWIRGHVYIYNLSISMTGTPKFEVQVTPYEVMP
jgi:hypothetical protein